jgi:dTDP-glucose 4,6-dehydratase
MEPGGFIQTDVYGTYVLLEAAKKYQIERYHQISTDEVYGAVLEGRSKETDKLHTRSPYSAAKAGGDLMCLAYYTSFGVPVTITRGSKILARTNTRRRWCRSLSPTHRRYSLPLYGITATARLQYVRDHCGD